ncbi:hypothetical protein P175DRAFT_0532875 [Aspergillus ochraceoroseus IBT 24754]|uniref:SnoaL-like domain-containing protein n=3 Tax=Aspergillus subgen. Nidulantes TaxID=2720870 RepID=A0A0F8WVT0_9EURO|nr:uncharacterized protein P175DRAFT_0532875 [Aspergillus ochraceoroseus IBT 24754]KKK15452.1 hypothetical protein ARAM_005770 [Aspergillus rambellii]KKK17892.1 hypothetical protein AOCH_004734 [Aspergillus ochraceoroseus]PTU19918.1 hypothetical protein P175DRAFT_0532875 [Aspergillus ochraceoroseus IBT 24754]
MRVTAISITLLSLIGSISARTLDDPDEFTSLGCPATTNANASPAEQLAAWEDFADLLYIRKSPRDALLKYAAAGYINHAPHVPESGRDNAIDYLSRNKGSNTVQLRHVYIGFDKNGTTYATAHFQATPENGNSSASVDISRMVGSCLVEHWEAGQKMDPSDNPIAYF